MILQRFAQTGHWALSPPQQMVPACPGACLCCSSKPSEMETCLGFTALKSALLSSCCVCAPHLPPFCVELSYLAAFCTQGETNPVPLEPLTGFLSLSLHVVAAASRALLLPNQGLQFADFWSTSVNFRQKYFYWKLGIKLSLCMRMMPQKSLHPWRREAPSILVSGLHTGLVTTGLHPFRHSGRTLGLELPWLLPQHCSLGWAGISCFASVVRDWWFGCCMSAHP